MTTKQDITAIITDKRGRVLSIGKNSYLKTHPLQKHHSERVGLPHKVFLHAEIDAIIKCKDLSKAHKIQVFRFNNKGEAMLAKPCAICEDALSRTPIRFIEHT